MQVKATENMRTGPSEKDIVYTALEEIMYNVVEECY